MKKQVLSLLAGLGLVLAAVAIPTSAQNPPDNGGAAGGDQGGGRGRGRNFDPAAMRQQRMDDLKKALGASDDEFKVLQPKIEKVEDLRRADLMARFAGRGRTGRPGGGGGGDNNAAGATPANPASENPVAKASAELKAALENKPQDEKAEKTQNELIKEKLAALRAAKAKAKEELTRAQTELREIVTVRQEAVLVAQGVLE